MHHLFLQSVRVPMRFENFFPASILILETEEPKDDPAAAWDFSDNPPTMSIGCRMGKVGIICALQDGGAQQQSYFPQLKKTLPPKLDPMQFREVTAKVRYKARLFNRIPKYIIIKGNEGPYMVVQNPPQGFSSKLLFDAWDQAEYAQVLSAMTRISVEHLFSPPDLVWTWLTGNQRRVVPVSPSFARPIGQKEVDY